MNAREQWLQERRTGIGGSDIGAILGISGFRTPLDVQQDKLGLVPDAPASEAMLWGIRHEAMIAEHYADITGSKVQRINQVLRHPEHEFMLANIDRAIVADGSRARFDGNQLKGATGILECKTASAFVAGRWGSDEDDQAPVEYVAQCMWYMGVTGMPWCDLAVLIGGNHFKVKRIERDEQVITDMIERARAWWQRHIVERIPCDPINPADAAKLYPQDNGATIEADNAAQDAVVRLHAVKQQIGALEAEESLLKTQIQSFMGEASVLTYGGNPVATWKASKAPMRFDSSGFKAAHPDLYGQYLKAGEASRRFTLKD